MKYVLTGGAGHITKPLAKSLLAAGHQVTVIGRNASNLEELTEAGATAAIGSVEDVAFLTGTFTGADAVYTMVPPKLDVSQWKNYIAQIGENYATALNKSGVRFVVNLSSIGAHLSDGVGPVSGLHRVEQTLNKVNDLNIRHLRPGFFYYNLFSNIDLIKQAGIIGGSYSITDNKMPIADPDDIAAAAAEELLNLSFKGHTARYVASDEISTDAIALEIGTAIGKPGLKWVRFTDEQALQGMIGAGLSEEIAKNYVEMTQALDTGIMSEDYWKNHAPVYGKKKLREFAGEFGVAFSS